MYSIGFSEKWNELKEKPEPLENVAKHLADISHKFDLKQTKQTLKEEFTFEEILELHRALIFINTQSEVWQTALRKISRYINQIQRESRRS